MRSPHLYDTLRRFCLGAFSVFQGEEPPVRVRGAPLVRRADAVRVPPAREGLHRGAGRAAASRARTSQQALDDLGREPAARVYKDRVPHGARPAARAHGRGLRRLRLGRRRVRPRVRGDGGARCSARATRTARWRRSSASRVGAPIELGDGSARAARARRASSRRCGPRRPASCRATSAARSTGCACSSSSARWRRRRTRCRTLPASSPTRSRRSVSRPPRRSPPAPCCSSGSTGARSGSGPCCRSRRRAPPGEPTRLDPFRAQVAAKLIPQLALADERRAPRRRARPLGARRSSRTTRSAASSSATRSTPRSATATARGRPRCAPPRCSARRRRSAADLAEQFRMPTPDLLRRLLVAMLLHGDRAGLVRELDRVAARPARRAARRVGRAASKLTTARAG